MWTAFRNGRRWVPSVGRHTGRRRSALARGPGLRKDRRLAGVTDAMRLRTKSFSLNLCLCRASFVLLVLLVAPGPLTAVPAPVRIGPADLHFDWASGGGTPSYTKPFCKPSFFGGVMTSCRN